MASDGKWRVTASRYVHKDHWISVRADDCVTDEGVVVAPYYVLDYPDWVEIIALDADDNVLLVRQYRHGFAGFSIELPAGGMEPAETDPVATATRELMEEAGCAGDMTLIGDTRPNAGTHSNRIHIALARNVIQVSEPVDDPTERIERFWVTAAEALRMALAGELTVGMQVASLLRGLSQAGVASITLAK